MRVKKRVDVFDEAVEECFESHRLASARITGWCLALSAMIVLGLFAWWLSTGGPR